MTQKCPECGCTKIWDQDCPDCEGSCECQFCQGEVQDDCPCECDDGECAACQGSGYNDGHCECSECGCADFSHKFDAEDGEQIIDKPEERE